MTPLEKAASAMRDAAIAYCDERRGMPDVDIPDAFLAAAAIRAFLEAAAEDEETAHRVADAHIDAFETLDRENMGQAAILALKEAVNAG